LLSYLLTKSFKSSQEIIYMFKPLVLSASLLMGGSLHAEDKSEKPKKEAPAGTVITKGSLLMKDSYKGIVLSSDSSLIKLDAKVWKDWKVISAVAHGSMVEEGDVLISFDSETYKKELEKKKKAFALAEVNYKKTLLSFEISAKKMQQKRKLAVISHKNALINKDMYESEGRQLTLDARNSSMKSAKLQLKYAEEEYKQLKEMYENDEVTETSEELVIERQRFMVERAQASMKKTDYQHRLNLKTSYPLSDLNREQQFLNIEGDKSVSDLDWEIQQKSHQAKLTAAKDAFKKTKKAFENFKKDGELLSLKATRDGQVFYGSEKKGKWLNSLGSQIKKDQKLMPGMSVMTLLNNKKMQIEVAIPFNKRASLKDNASFALFPSGSTAREATFVSCSKSPVNDKLTAVFEVNNSKGLYQGIGSTLNVIRKKSDLVLVSNKSIKRNELKPWITYVTVMREGKKIKIPVTLGESYNGKTIITSGIKINDRVL